MCLDGHGGTSEAQGICDAFLKKEIKRAYCNERLRQAGQVFRKGGGVVTNRFGWDGMIGQQLLPTEPIRFPRPDKLSRAGVVNRCLCCSGPRIEHRIDQQLGSELMLGPITCEQRQGCRKAAACATAHDHDACRINAKLLGVIKQPIEGCVAIFDRLRKWVFRSKAIIDGNDHGTVFVADRAALRAHHLGCAREEAAAMEMDYGRHTWRHHFRPVEQDPNGRSTLNPRNPALLVVQRSREYSLRVGVSHYAPVFGEGLFCWIVGGKRPDEVLSRGV